MIRNNMAARPNSLVSWLLVFLLLVVFAMGGSSRADIQSLVILRPLAVILVALGLRSLTQDHVRPHRLLFVIAGLMFAITLLHLLPLPPALWTTLPGRTLSAEIDTVFGLQDVWRPLSLVPAATWNALFSLLVPLAALIFVVQIGREQLLGFILPLILIIGLVSGVFGLLQAVGPESGPFYFYRITNNNMAVGLFSNRNHQAVFLATLFPMLAVYASAGVQSVDQLRLRGWISLAAGAFLIPLILVTGSRAGLLGALLGIACSLFLYQPQKDLTPEKRKSAKSYSRYIYVAAGALSFATLTFLLARAEALERLLESDPAADSRWATLGPIINTAWSYFPAGSGIGSFVEVYQVHEPNAVLSTYYINHAHNDWLEVFLTAGIPGVLIAAIALFAYLKSIWIIFRAKKPSGRDRQFAQLGAVILGMLVVASLVDYPLRVPSLSCLFVIAAVWLSAGAKAERPT